MYYRSLLAGLILSPAAMAQMAVADSDIALHAPGPEWQAYGKAQAWAAYDPIPVKDFSGDWGRHYTPRDGRFEEGPVGAELCRRAIDESIRVGAWGTIVCSNAAPQHAMWADVALQQECNAAFLTSTPIRTA